jgi:hypothetical protein
MRRRPDPSFAAHCGRSQVATGRRSRPTNAEAGLALLTPSIALLTFPHRFGRPENPLHFYLGGFIPHYDWKYLPETCMGSPYGPIEAVRTELLLGLADDLFIFTIAMFGVGLLAAALTSVRVGRARCPPRIALWTLVTAVLSVLAWSKLWGVILVT